MQAATVSVGQRSKWRLLPVMGTPLSAVRKVLIRHASAWSSRTKLRQDTTELAARTEHRDYRRASRSKTGASSAAATLIKVSVGLRAATIAAACDSPAVARSGPPTSRAWPSHRDRAIAAAAMPEVSGQFQSDVQRNAAAIAPGPSTDLPTQSPRSSRHSTREDVGGCVTSERLHTSAPYLGPLIASSWADARETISSICLRVA